MPHHILPVSRRHFLRNSALAAAGLVVFRHAHAADTTTTSRWALLSDTHIAADTARTAREANMADHLKRAVAEVLAWENKPAGVLINGDCALTDGQPGDYATLAELIQPLPAADLPVHMTLGNHDDRTNFVAGIKPGEASTKHVEGRHLSVIETPHANWFLLDSLEKVNMTLGLLGQAQRDWLATALDARKEKPALVMVHHTPQIIAPGSNAKPFGLADTAELLEILLPRKHVKALFYGHSHKWEITAKEGLHLINLPAVAYTFAKDQPTGWVQCQLAAGSMSLQLRAKDTTHPGHAKTTDLQWRV